VRRAKRNPRPYRDHPQNSHSITSVVAGGGSPLCRGKLLRANVEGLAHVPKNVVEGAYNRAEHLERRIELAQAWADLIMIDQTPIDDLLNLRRLPAPRIETTAKI
jgi:hypothetical protein